LLYYKRTEEYVRKKTVKKGGEKGKIKKKKLIGALMVSRSKFFGPNEVTKK